MKNFLSAFWNELAPQVHGDSDTLAIASFIATCPESLSSPLGIFRLPLSRISETLGIDDAKICESIDVLSDLAFLVYSLEMVFLREAAGHHFGEVPNLRNKHLRGLARDYPEFRDRYPLICEAFEERYRAWKDFFQFSESIVTQENIDEAERQALALVFDELRHEYGKKSFTSAELTERCLTLMGRSPRQIGQVLHRLREVTMNGARLVRSGRVSEGYLWKFASVPETP